MNENNIEKESYEDNIRKRIKALDKTLRYSMNPIEQRQIRQNIAKLQKQLKQAKYNK